MTVYVDNFGVPATCTDEHTGRSYSAKWSHLLTDLADQTELHELASQIGMQRRWFQQKPPNTPWRWHYDVTARRRLLAIKAGAVPIPWNEIPEVLARARAAHETVDITTDDTEWCITLGCVRPVSYHPGGMHLTEDGREFGNPRPTLRAVPR